MRGQFTHARYQQELELVRSTLGKSNEPHWREYLAVWPESARS
jgi:3'-5' exonuclease